MNVLVRCFGMIVFITVLAGLVLLIGELIWYRLPAGTARRPGYGAGRLKRIALITGAGSGLGRAYARRIDRRVSRIDEIWLVGRREDRLQETADLLKKPVRCLALDLTKSESITSIRNEIHKEKIRVSFLVNCAGAGRTGLTKALPVREQIRMIELNCSAVVALTDVCLPYMQEGDHILNVCSSAAFQPLQRLNVYASTKAFLLRYTRALRHELLPDKIMVTAVCPYWIKDTEFIEKTEENNKEEIHSYPLASMVSSVAALSLAGCRLGLPVVTPGIVCTVHRIFSGLIPDVVLQYIWEGIRRL